MSKLGRRVTRVLQRTRRRVLTALAGPATPARIDEIERFDHPMAAKLARALRRIRAHDHAAADRWIRAIEAEREKLEASRAPLAPTAQMEGPYDRGLTVADACGASRRLPGVMALHLFARELAPARVLELGTNVGVSSAYFASALEDLGAGVVVTLEASPARQAIARRLHEAVGLRRVEYVLGLFDATLESALASPVDLAFIDGHHQYRPTLDYFDRIWKRSNEGTVFLFDDIRWTRGMEKAWKELQADPRLRVVVDLCGVGIGIGTREPSATGRLVTKVLAV